MSDQDQDNQTEDTSIDTQQIKDAAKKTANQVKSTVTKLPRWEQLTLGGGIVYLISLYAIDYLKVKTSGSIANLADSSYNNGFSFADDGGFWFFLALAGAIIGVVLPFLHLIAPKIKLPLAKGLLYFVAGIATILAPVANYIFTPDKSHTYYGMTIKLTPDIGFFVLLIAGAVIAFGGYQAGGLKKLLNLIQKTQKSGDTPAAEE